MFFLSGGPQGECHEVETLPRESLLGAPPAPSLVQPPGTIYNPCHSHGAGGLGQGQREHVCPACPRTRAWLAHK